MLGNIVFSRVKRTDAAQLKDAPVTGHNRQLVHAHQGLAQLLIIQAVRSLAPTALSFVPRINGFFAQRFLKLFERSAFLAAEEDHAVTIAHDCISVVLIKRFQLALRLKHQTGRYLAAADRRHELFKLWNLADVCSLINQAAHMHRQPAAVHVICLFAEQIEQLRVAHRNQEIETIISIRHDEKQRRLLIAKRIQFQLVIGSDLAQLCNIEHSETRTAGNQDRLRRFARCQFELLILPDSEVFRLAFFQSNKQVIHPVCELLVILARLHAVNHGNQRGEVSLILRTDVMQITDQGGIEQRLRLLPKLVSGFSVSLGIGNQAIYQLEDVFF